MKSLVLISLLITGIGMAACTKKASEIPIIDDMDSTAMVLFSGRFMNGPYGAAMGVARIEAVNDQWQLRLDSFTVSNGPDLKVYLSKEQQPIHFISLGNLRSTSGSQVYTISGMPDIAAYRYALVHCEKYNHLFGSALLEMK
jgi:hypothetical protein